MRKNALILSSALAALTVLLHSPRPARADDGTGAPNLDHCASPGLHYTSINDLLTVNGDLARRWYAQENAAQAARMLRRSPASAVASVSPPGVLERLRVWRVGSGPGSQYLLELPSTVQGSSGIEAQGGLFLEDGLSGDARVSDRGELRAAVMLDGGALHVAYEQDLRVMRVRLGSRMQLVGYSSVSLRASTPVGQPSVTGTAIAGTGVAWESSDEHAAVLRQRQRPRFRIAITGGPGGSIGANRAPALSGEIMTAAELRF